MQKLADRKNIGVIDGTRLMGAKPIGVDFQRGCAYAEQQDEHEWTQTVRESLRFSAYLRQPASVSVEGAFAAHRDHSDALQRRTPTSRKSSSCSRWTTLPTR